VKHLKQRERYFFFLLMVQCVATDRDTIESRLFVYLLFAFRFSEYLTPERSLKSDETESLHRIHKQTNERDPRSLMLRKSHEKKTYYAFPCASRARSHVFRGTMCAHYLVRGRRKPSLINGTPNLIDVAVSRAKELSAYRYGSFYSHS